MAKYEVKRTNLYYMMNDKAITDLDCVLSFRADVEGSTKNYWCGFYDFNIEKYRVFPSGTDEMYCLELSSDGEETLGEFENNLRILIYEYTDDWVRLVKVADDCSCMEDMKWPQNT